MSARVIWHSRQWMIQLIFVYFMVFLGVISSEQKCCKWMRLRLVNHQLDMKATIICIALIFSAYSTAILKSSTTSTTVISPAGATVVESRLGTNWIKSSIVAQTVYQAVFNSRCGEAGDVSVVSNSHFTVYFDGIQLGRGGGGEILNNYELKLGCGNHNLTIAVDSQQWITFTINQDQANCFKCNSYGFWNQKTCSCQCIGSQYDCSCIQPKVWREYPTCGCRCPPRIFPLTGTLDLKTATDPSNEVVDFNDDNGEGSYKRIILLDPPFPWMCPGYQYYDELTCQCKCHIKFCKRGYFFDRDQCWCRIID